jgi:hypothetical protein
MKSKFREQHALHGNSLKRTLITCTLITCTIHIFNAQLFLTKKGRFYVLPQKTITIYDLC